MFALPFGLSALVAWFRPAWYPALLFGLLWWEQLLHAGGLNVYALEWALAGGSLALAAGMARRRLARPPAALALCMAPLALVLAAHAAWPGPLGGSVKAILRFGQFWLGLLLPVWLLAADAAARRLALRAAMALGVAACLLGLAQVAAGPHSALSLGHEDEVVLGRVQEAFSFFNHHNQFAVFLCAWLPLAAAFAWDARRHGRRGDLALGAVACALGALCLLFSFSRGAWIGLGAGALLAALFLPGRWKFAPPAALALALAAAFALSPTVRSRLTVADRDRAELRRFGVEIQGGHWAWGAGAGSVDAQLPAKVQALGRSAEATRNLSNSLHNLYLQVAVEFGLAGLLAFACLAAAAPALALRRLWRHGPDPWALAALAGSTAFLVKSLSDPTLGYARGLGISLCLGLALACMAAAEAGRDNR